MATIHLGNRSLRLIGSVHSTASCISEIKNTNPSHIFIESSKDVIGLIKRDPKHSPRLIDLPSVVRYCEDSRTPLHAIDTSVSDISIRVFSCMSVYDKTLLWKYALQSALCVPLAHILFVSIVNRERSNLDSFVTRWAVPKTLLEDCRRVIGSGGNAETLMALLQKRQDVASFLASPDYDHTAYTELCERTCIDKMLQSVVIDYRNDFMCHQVRRIVRTIPEGSLCAVVVGKNHVEGMAWNFGKGLDYVPECITGDNHGKDATFIDRFLLAQLLRS